MSEEKRALIIIWTWDTLLEVEIDSINEKEIPKYNEKLKSFLNNQNNFTIEIEDSKKTLLIGYTNSNEYFDQKTSSKKKVKNYTVQEIKDKINELINNNYRIILFLHKSIPDKFTGNNQLFTDFKNERKIKIKLFGGGNDIPLYKDLLNDFDNFLSSSDVIKKEVFNSVWDFYWNECKKKLYELKEDLLFTLYPYFWSNSTIENLKLSELLIKRIRNLISDYPINDDDKEKIEFTKLEKDNKNYYNFKECKNVYNQFCKEEYDILKNILKYILKKDTENILKSINDNNITINDITEVLKNKFDKILTSYSGPIY